MKNFLHKLLRVPAPREIALIDVPTDQERAAQLAAKAQAAREAMGRTYALHPANRVLSGKQRAPINRASVRASARQKAQP
jgi:hypothetical protein